MESKKLTIEELIDNYKNRLDWDDVSLKINITQFEDDFLKRYQDWLNWDIISQNQYMHEEFINKYSNLLNMDLVKNNERIPDKIKDSVFGKEKEGV